MFGKSLIPLLTTTLLACSISPAWGQDNISSEITFTCEENNGIPITVIRDKHNNSENIFHYKQDALSGFANSKQLCDDIAEKLNSYYQEKGQFLYTWSREINFFTDLKSDRLQIMYQLALFENEI